MSDDRRGIGRRSFLVATLTSGAVGALGGLGAARALWGGAPPAAAAPFAQMPIVEKYHLIRINDIYFAFLEASEALLGSFKSSTEFGEGAYAAWDYCMQNYFYVYINDYMARVNKIAGETNLISAPDPDTSVAAMSESAQAFPAAWAFYIEAMIGHTPQMASAFLNWGR